MQKNWIVLPQPPLEFLEAHPELQPIVSELLYQRKLVTPAAIDEFLNPDYSQDIHDPFLFRDMRKAVERLFQAIEKKERLTIHGDYDADGVSASVILTGLFNALDYHNFSVFLPHRETDGYGLNKNTVQLLASEGTKVIITCDCGISNQEEVTLANSFGMDVIITDHHTVPPILPDAYAIIHPKVPEETYPDKTLSGGGVAFKLLQAMLQLHEQKHELLPNGERPEALEKWSLDMVAISSVADMVPLLHESRTLTKYGLIVLNKTRRIGLQKLLLEARLMHNDGQMKSELTTDTIGFQIAPRINAAGRMNHANVAYRLLVTNDPIEAINLAYELNQNNQERQRLVEGVMREAVKQAEAQKEMPVLFIIGNDWPVGIIGLIAGKIKERYYKPTMVITQSQAELIGSGRSIAELDMIEALQEIPQVFKKFGGHPMACGFTLNPAISLTECQTICTQKFQEKIIISDTSAKLIIDAQIDLDEVNWELYDIIQKFSPFGQDNPKPKYLARDLTVTALEPVGKDKKHLRLMVRSKTGRIRKTIGWGLCNPEKNDQVDWGKALAIGDKIDLVFEIDVNEWNGNRELQLTIVDLRRAL